MNHIQRIPLVTRHPISISDLRTPVFVEDDSWYPISKFEGIYEISLSGLVRNTKSGDLVRVYENNIDVIILRHPNGDGSTLTCNLIDVYSDTFLNSQYLYEYSYMRDL